MPLYISKAAAARILNVKYNDIKEVKIYKGKVICKYVCNKGNCCTFISFKDFKHDFLSLRLEAHIKNKVEVTNVSDINDLQTVRAFVKYETSHDIHTVEVIQGEYICSCQDFQRQKEVGNGFTHPLCKHLLPVALNLGFKTFSSLVKSTVVQKELAIA